MSTRPDPSADAPGEPAPRTPGATRRPSSADGPVLPGLDVPVLAAPMAGGPTTPELVAAVGDAGGFGFLAAGYRTTADTLDMIRRLNETGARPYGLNLFVPSGRGRPDDAAIDAYARSLAPDAHALGTEPGTPRRDDDAYAEKLAAVLALPAHLRPAVVSFTFGCPDAAVLARLAGAGITTMVTVTTAGEAALAERRGARLLTVQGPDAGGHRGTFDPAAEPTTAPLTDTLTAVAARTSLPYAAGGGIATAGDVADVLAHGAFAAQIGTALLLADEAGTGRAHRAAFDVFGTTAPTRAFTGRVARGLANRFMADHPDAPAAYPQVHFLTSPLRRAAARAGDLDRLHLWAGTGFRRARALPAADIVAGLVPR